MKFAVALLLLILLIGGVLYWFQNKNITIIPDSPPQEGEITYVALGDSYTIGNGVDASERWPNLMVRHLKETGIPVKLVANPSVSGYTVKNALERELPIVEQTKPDFVTVLIGANDNFGGKGVDIYQEELKYFLDQLQKKLKNPQNIVLVTIPDYSASPSQSDSHDAEVSESIRQYNRVIRQEADQRKLKVADIFPVSQKMTSAADYIRDGLHPSAQGYAKWEAEIYPVVLEQLKQSN